MRAASVDDTMLDAERKASPFCAERTIVVNGPYAKGHVSSLDSQILDLHVRKTIAA
jgi:hypothetical protein